eukprot:scaffold86536_cov33-Tisochrysis_lutea.AAC.1
MSYSVVFHMTSGATNQPGGGGAVGSSCRQGALRPIMTCRGSARWLAGQATSTLWNVNVVLSRAYDRCAILWHVQYFVRCNQNFVMVDSCLGCCLLFLFLACVVFVHMCVHLTCRTSRVEPSHLVYRQSVAPRPDS